MQTDQSSNFSQERIIGIDPGRVRTGIAMADPGLMLASPLNVIDTNPMQTFASRLSHALQDYEIGLVIVGLPLDLQGREGESAQLARQLGEQLASELGWALEYVDERFSTTLASTGMRDSGKKLRKRRQEIDAHAAAVILQGWLDYGRQRLPED